MQDHERHTDTACKEVAASDECCSRVFPEDARLQNVLNDKMMNCAVEFEENGFIAGFNTAFYMLFGLDNGFSFSTQQTTSPAGKSQHRVIQDSQWCSKKPQIDKEMENKKSEKAKIVHEKSWINILTQSRYLKCSADPISKP